MIQSSTEVRKNWGAFIDDVMRKKPAFVKRSRDIFTVLSIEQLDLILSKYSMSGHIIAEEDGSYTATINEIDLVANDETKDGVKEKLIDDLLEYAEEYIEEFSLYYHSSNRREHFPYIYKTLAHAHEKDKISELLNLEEK
ncbi:hypothetical protein [Vallitalea okinawensis]|uniref:hypothetical protein n=1 Tax=Vallitalea okinawensis TaxID=2078660 RepID=UPI000CFB737D|nr:hypothetical protein [Vallitalea okinawensis]